MADLGKASLWLKKNDCYFAEVNKLWEKQGNKFKVLTKSKKAKEM